MKRTYWFDDAVEMNKKYPDTFTLPDLTSVKIGSYVKVCLNDERFWVLVTGMDEQVITGRVANDLIIAPLKYHDKIWFEFRHIYAVDNGELGSVDPVDGAEPAENLHGVHATCN